MEAFGFGLVLFLFFVFVFFGLFFYYLYVASKGLEKNGKKISRKQGLNEKVGQSSLPHPQSNTSDD